MRTEFQIIYNTSLMEAYSLYKDFWSPNLISRKEFLKPSKDIKLLEEEIANYSVMYTNLDKIFVPLISRHRSLPSINTRELSQKLQTTVVHYSQWEETYLEIANNGELELSLEVDLEENSFLDQDYHERFTKAVPFLKKDYSLFIKEIQRIMKIKFLTHIPEDVSEIQKAISYEFFGNWKNTS